jgi:hypothetical protein
MRQPKPWIRSQTNSWYVEVGGRQHSLEVHPEDADPPKRTKTGWNPPQSVLDAYYKLMAW